MGLEFGLDRLVATHPTKKTDKSTQHARRAKCHSRRLSSPRRGNSRFLRGVDLSTPSVCGVVWCGVVWCGVVWCGVVWCGVVWCEKYSE